ncbi:hypothetical protein M3666_09030 [Curtobacterium sp. ODYSSEY 48 V2]|jgi:hypothetical protein|uniref:hypothetical protein n=1 Tax=unclassified Curtobacterium TaxID=257496 RepID=UPI0020421C65|nr:MULTISPECIES: hypothetical protein [unclassified Curtobacterium]MCM3505254.1 hypothetical protein [Curtobacterium sp. ODYSSEY 48 V2]MDT0209604.1 hypothetical protein [Curtobacterium sp. BRD11]
MDTALTTAAIAATASIAAAVVSWFGAFQARRTAVRHHAWERFTWALEQRPGDRAHDISIAVLRHLATVAWWSKADRRLAHRALRRQSQSGYRASTPTGEDLG